MHMITAREQIIKYLGIGNIEKIPTRIVWEIQKCKYVQGVPFKNNEFLPFTIHHIAPPITTTLYDIPRSARGSRVKTPLVTKLP